MSELLVASGVAVACGFLGVTDWLLARAQRSRAGHRGSSSLRRRDPLDAPERQASPRWRVHEE